jgi:serine/threonine-protein kinase
VLHALANDPEQRYADAADMEAALRNGLHGRAPADVDETAFLPPDEDSTEATQMLAPTRTAAAPARRRMQPIDEPVPAAVSTPPPRRGGPRSRPAAPPPRTGGGAGKWVALLVVLALVIGGLALWQSSGGGNSGPVQLRQNVSGKVQDGVDQLKGLIQDNTR